MKESQRLLLNGDEAVAYGALDAGIALGSGYPGTPSTEVLETYSGIGGNAQWAPNEKVALEVGIGVSFAGARTLVTMKHVGVNVAADPLFTIAYSGVNGALVLLVADDPGMASSQNEQDTRNYAFAAGVPLVEPSDSQEAYDLVAKAVELSERWKTPVFLRLTTRICHSKTIVNRRPALTPPAPNFVRDIKTRVMVPAYARPAHRRLRQKLDEIQQWNETSDLNRIIDGDKSLGIISSGVAFIHAREAAPEAKMLKIGMTYPLPIEKMRSFAESVDRCVVIEDSDPWIAMMAKSAGIPVEAKPEMFRFGELNVDRIRRIIARDTTPEQPPKPGRPPQLCIGCPHRSVYEILSKKKLIVSGDIGCYTLGVLPPFEAIDTCVCMGASIGVGLGLRHVLPEEQARKVVSVIGDSTFAHSGLTGLVEAVYNPPPTGHVVLILDNGTTAMTGLQEHPGTGRKLNHQPTAQLVFEDVAKAMGIKNVFIFNPTKEQDKFEKTLDECLASNEISVIITRRPCLLAAKKMRATEAATGGTSNA